MIGLRQSLDFVGRHVEHFGARRTLLKVAAVVLKRLGLLDVCNCQILLVADKNPQLLALEPPFESRFLLPAEVEKLAREPQNRLPRWFVDEARRKGDDCHAILDGNNLASFGWYSRQTTIALGGFIHFPTHYVYMYHGHTLPRYRGQRLHGIGITRALESYARAGCAAVISIVDTTNYASRASSKRMGFRDLGRLYKLGPGRRSRVLTTGECTDHGIRITPHRNPRGA